ncbi:mechanosensitive ion channel family protein [Paenibacillus sp. J5C_2022]|uniref:mechanosensitive ion channel family protein n=1 Tax=Paenibacillus sp. J5C2022 TaxID=2977129 RepID=UPI0021CF9717|nr:mechanosensitive ion channel family protein [Paenibacillus sp. J5C2022]MCU6708801.1 mechanosensitive ion channel family protein [Paenibacillus sp. J5C2022]
MDLLNEWIADFGMGEQMSLYVANAIMIVIIIGLSVAANFIAKSIVLRIVSYYIRNSKVKWDDYLLERKVFHKISHVVPAIIIYFSSSLFPKFQHLIEQGTAIYIIVVALMVINAFLNAVNDIYVTYEISKARPIRGYIQVVKIFVFTIGGILIVSNLIGQSPLILLSGIGALSAVTMLVFKDSILGLVAGVQLTSNDMVRVGDWIEMPKYGADGDVVDISLHTVKVQNWDKTYTTIPSYALISDSFKNWRGMQTSGGRRIMRSLSIDTTSITICSPEMIEKLKKIHVLKAYIAQKELDIERYHVEHKIDRSSNVNGRALTNIGMFRAYIQSYLRNHPGIHKEMTCMVRQLQPDGTGLPLQIYAFVNDVRWEIFEGVQSDIFDHLLAVAPEFGIRVFQNPSGHDLKSALQGELPERARDRVMVSEAD